jgi:hypothetical protein
MHLPILNPVTSSPVITALTPGTWRAFSVWILVIRPDEIGLRKTLPQRISGSFTSAL